MKYLIYLLPFLLASCTTAQMAAHDLQDQAMLVADKNQAIVKYEQCPATFVVEELGFLTDYAPLAKRTEKQLRSRVAMTKSSSTCVYEDQSVSVDVTLNFRGKLGPKGRVRKGDDPLYSYPFFVAITNNGGKILAKEIFAATMPYPNDSDEGFYTETIRQIIPVPSAQKGKHFAVMAGFQLSDEQLAENREFIKETRIAAKLAAKEKKMQAAQAQKLNSATGRARTSGDVDVPALQKFAPTNAHTLVPSDRSE